MHGASELLVRVAAVSAIVAVVLVSSWARRYRDAWGAAPDHSFAVGDGAYRRWRVTSYVPRGVPPFVALVAGLSVTWGIITLLVFAPLGFGFLLAPVRHDAAREVLLAMSGLGAFGTSISGMGLGASLIAIARRLIQRHRDAFERAASLAAWSAVHHGCVFLSFSMFACFERDPDIALAVAIPCVLGWIHASALGHAAEIVGRNHDERPPLAERSGQICI